MEQRIFLATKKENTVGVCFLPNEQSADGKKGKAIGIPTITYEHEGEMQGFSDTRLSGMHALIKVIEDTNVEELTNVVPVFVIPVVYNFINGDTYKFWALTGKKQTGEEIPQAELDMINKFKEVWKEKGDYFAIRDIFTCSIPDKIKADPSKLSKYKLYNRQNDAYSRYCWNKIAKLYNESVEDSIASVSV